jgi:hypothetical protein
VLQQEFSEARKTACDGRILTIARINRAHAAFSCAAAQSPANCLPVAHLQIADYVGKYCLFFGFFAYFLIHSVVARLTAVLIGS